MDGVKTVAQTGVQAEVLQRLTRVETKMDNMDDKLARSDRSQ